MGRVSSACGNGTRCVAWAMMDDPRHVAAARAGALLESEAAPCGEARLGPRVHGGHGAATPALGPDPALRAFQDTRTIELQIGPIDAPILHSPSAVSMGNPHAIFWVDDPEAYDLARIGRFWKVTRSSRSGPHLARGGRSAGPDSGPGVGTGVG
jgi:diaminopimelate epimerase